MMIGGPAMIAARMTGEAERIGEAPIAGPTEEAAIGVRANAEPRVVVRPSAGSLAQRRWRRLEIRLRNT
jgi:hypothetical protein